MALSHTLCSHWNHFPRLCSAQLWASRGLEGGDGGQNETLASLQERAICSPTAVCPTVVPWPGGLALPADGTDIVFPSHVSSSFGHLLRAVSVCHPALRTPFHISAPWPCFALEDFPPRLCLMPAVAGTHLGQVCAREGAVHPLGTNTLPAPPVSTCWTLPSSWQPVCSPGVHSCTFSLLVFLPIKVLFLFLP